MSENLKSYQSTMSKRIQRMSKQTQGKWLPIKQGKWHRRRQGKWHPIKQGKWHRRRQNQLTRLFSVICQLNTLIHLICANVWGVDWTTRKHRSFADTTQLASLKQTSTHLSITSVTNNAIQNQSAANDLTNIFTQSTSQKRTKNTQSFPLLVKHNK
jgi:hypothetical protein